MKRVYLDYNSTTPVDARVSSRFLEALGVEGNPSAMVQSGREAKEVVESARATLARYIGASDWQVVFSHSGSEGNNQVIKSVVFRALAARQSAHIIVSAIEHSSIIKTCQWITEFEGISVTVVGVDASGHVNPDEIQTAIRPDTRLICVMAANNEIGSIQSIQAIGQLARPAGVLLLVDAVQGLGKMPLNVSEWDVDFMTFSSHKCYAPKGVGALYVRDDAQLSPLIHGGSQEHQLIAGTENVAGIAAFGHAIEVMNAVETESFLDQERIRGLAQQLETGILASISDVVCNHPAQNRLAGTLNMSFYGVSGESLMVALDMAGIEVSTGSACSTGSIDPSHVLSAVCKETWRVQSGIRMSLGRFSTAEDIEFTLRTLPLIVERCRKARSKN